VLYSLGPDERRCYFVPCCQYIPFGRPYLWRTSIAGTLESQITFEHLKEFEMRLFPGNKSYFRCLEEQLDEPAEDDPEYIVISD
jgi:hypothetical protein